MSRVRSHRIEIRKDHIIRIFEGRRRVLETIGNTIADRRIRVRRIVGWVDVGNCGAEDDRPPGEAIVRAALRVIDREPRSLAVPAR